MPPAKILVVDDEPDLELLIRQRFRRQIRNGEFVFVFAHNGIEALQRLQEFPDIDIVLTDINMPEMDGLTLLIKLGELDLAGRTLSATDTIGHEESAVVPLSKALFLDYVGGAFLDQLRISVSLHAGRAVEPAGRTIIQLGLPLVQYQVAGKYRFPLAGKLFIANLPGNLSQHRGGFSQEFSFDVVVAEQIGNFITPQKELPTSLPAYPTYRRDVLGHFPPRDGNIARRIAERVRLVHIQEGKMRRVHHQQVGCLLLHCLHHLLPWLVGYADALHGVHTRRGRQAAQDLAHMPCWKCRAAKGFAFSDADDPQQFDVRRIGDEGGGIHCRPGVDAVDDRNQHLLEQPGRVAFAHGSTFHQQRGNPLAVDPIPGILRQHPLPHRIGLAEAKDRGDLTGDLLMLAPECS